MFGKAVPLFNILGFQVKLDFSWLLLAFLITWSLSRGYFPYQFPDLAQGTYWSLGLLGMLGLMASLLFHELSHALVARAYGLPIGGITLFIFGGVAEMQNEPENAKTEFLVAIAGPIASLVLGGVFAILASFGGEAGLFGLTGGALFGYLSLINVILAVFNMIPAFPLDGGRVLRAALWHWGGSLRRATRTASQVGGGFGLLLIVFGVLFILSGNLVGGAWWIVIGLFVRAAANGSYYQLVTRQVLEGEPISRFMTRDPVCVAPDLTIDRFVEEYIYRYHHDLFPVLQGNRVLGAVGPRQIRQIRREEWPETPVGDVMIPLSDAIATDPDTDTAHLVMEMQRASQSRYLVVRGGELHGIVTLKDVMALLQLKMDLGGTAR